MRIRNGDWKDATKHWIPIGIVLLIVGLAGIFSIIIVLLHSKFDGPLCVTSGALSIMSLLILGLSIAHLRKNFQDKNRIHKIFVLSKEINPNYERRLIAFNTIMENILNKNELKFKKITGEDDLTLNRIIVAYELIDHNIELRIRACGLFDSHDSIFISLGPHTNTNQKLINKLKKSIDNTFS